MTQTWLPCLEELETLDLIKKIHANTFHLNDFHEKIVKIGPVNTEIALLIVKK